MASCDTHVPITGENIAPTESVDNQRLSPATETNGPNKVNGDQTPSESLESTGASQSVIDPTPENEPTSCNLETRKVARAKKRDIDQSLKMLLNANDSSESKLDALCKKYTEFAEEHKQLKNKYKLLEKQLTLTVREKEQLQTEHSKAVLAKSKLESLCRELHRHNEQIKQESLTRAKEEEEKRKEVTARFQTTITEIQQQMTEHYTKNSLLREENNDLGNKLKNLIEQYELREQQIEKLFKHKELEQQLSDAKLAQANLLFAEEKERNLTEKQKMLEDTAATQRKIVMQEAEEKQLRAQVALYTEKYEEFQGTLQKSNDVFQSFKVEMDKMTKKIKNLEKETSLWKAKCDTSTKEKVQKEQEVVTLQKKLQKLESLCRALQEERRNKPASPVPDSAINGDAPQDSGTEALVGETVNKNPGQEVEHANDTGITATSTAACEAAAGDDASACVSTSPDEVQQEVASASQTAGDDASSSDSQPSAPHPPPTTAGGDLAVVT